MKMQILLCVLLILSGLPAAAIRSQDVVAEPTTEPPKEIVNSIGMKLVLIPHGAFQMGSPTQEKGRDQDEHPHQVTLSRDYYLGAFEVTQAQYQRVMGSNPSLFQGDPVQDVDSFHYPVEQVSWDDAVEFCRRLSALPEEQQAGRVYRLPTEAEWEYACRAGSQSAYCFGDEQARLDDYAWHHGNSGGKTQPVGAKQPNPWGLYDMHGNVWEWCRDGYDDYSTDPSADPIGSTESSARVLRGGGWNYLATGCRSANRNWFAPSKGYSPFGFRVAW